MDNSIKITCSNKSLVYLQNYLFANKGKWLLYSEALNVEFIYFLYWKEQLVYIGYTKLYNRITQHRKIAEGYKHFDNFNFLAIMDGRGLEYERNLIQSFCPVYNRQDNIIYQGIGKNEYASKKRALRHEWVIAEKQRLGVPLSNYESNLIKNG
jgi:hypothetical protein